MTTLTTLIMAGSIDQLIAHNPKFKRQLLVAKQGNLPPKWGHWFLARLKEGAKPELALDVANRWEQALNRKQVEKAIRARILPVQAKDVGWWTKQPLAALEKALGTLASSTPSGASQTKATGAITLFDNGRILAVAPRTHGACCLYGKGTKWCITEKDKQTWLDYTGGVEANSAFVFVLDTQPWPPNSPWAKIALSINVGKPMTASNTEIFTADDDEVGFDAFKKALGPQMFADLQKAVNTYTTNKNNFKPLPRKPNGTIERGDVIKFTPTGSAQLGECMKAKAGLDYLKPDKKEILMLAAALSKVRGYVRARASFDELASSSKTRSYFIKEGIDWTFSTFPLKMC